jgi:hypothetical protein
MKRELNDYSVKSKVSVEELFKNKNLTFEDIEKLEFQEYKLTKSTKKKDFDPSDYIDLDNSIEDDEILNKFKKKSTQKLKFPTIPSSGYYKYNS